MFYQYDLNELATYCESHGHPKAHARTMFSWVHKDSNRTWDSISRISQNLLTQIKSTMPIGTSEISQANVSKYDQSVKFLIKLHDGMEIESVLMPETDRLTLCLSTQVGCRQGCTFCYTGRMGLIRNLKASEIVEQVALANHWIQTQPFSPNESFNRPIPQNGRITNIVFMGMGEPLDNVPELVKAIRILTEPAGLNLSLNKIAVSTAGHLEGLESLHNQLPTIPTALSLHAVTNEKRSQLLPINRRFPLESVLSYLKQHYQNLGGRHFLMVQYTVIRGVNDSVDDAIQMANLLMGIPVKINLIPLNEIEPTRFKGPDHEQLGQFRQVLHNLGLRTMIRYSKGQDIGAACGQLVVTSKKN